MDYRVVKSQLHIQAQAHGHHEDAMGDLIDRLARPLKAVLTDCRWYVRGAAKLMAIIAASVLFAVWFGFVSGAPGTVWRGTIQLVAWLLATFWELVTGLIGIIR
jgi:hypothetical protein